MGEARPHRPTPAPKRGGEEEFELATRLGRPRLRGGRGVTFRRTPGARRREIGAAEVRRGGFHPIQRRDGWFPNPQSSKVRGYGTSRRVHWSWPEILLKLTDVLKKDPVLFEHPLVTKLATTLVTKLVIKLWLFRG